MLILILRDWQPDRLTSTAETEKITADFCQISGQTKERKFQICVNQRL